MTIAFTGHPEYDWPRPMPPGGWTEMFAQHNERNMDCANNCPKLEGLSSEERLAKIEGCLGSVVCDERVDCGYDHNNVTAIAYATEEGSLKIRPIRWKSDGKIDTSIGLDEKGLYYNKTFEIKEG
jgi:hypothetical protein